MINKTKGGYMYIMHFISEQAPPNMLNTAVAPQG